jgi:hypothetical protein
LSQDVDPFDGNVDVDSILDLARRPSGHRREVLVENRRTRVKVNDRVNVYVAVKLKVLVEV